MKFIGYLIGIILIAAGVVSLFFLVPWLNAESYVNGDLDINNTFSQEAFSYFSTSVTLYHDIYDEEEAYTYSKTLLPVENFNGIENDYEILFNNHHILNAEITAGEVSFEVPISFLNTEGEVDVNTTLNVKITFFDDRTELNLSTKGVEEAQFLETYFQINGLTIEINEKVEN